MDLRQDVQELLRGFTPTGPREESDLERMQELLAAVGDPFSRLHFDPGHFTASALVLSPQRDAVLMILHGKLGLWLQPGGHVEPQDRSLLEAACREVREETGVAVRGLSDDLFDVDIHAIPARGAEPLHHHFDLRFLVVADRRELVADAEVRDARWVPLKQIACLETDDSVRRMVHRAAGRGSIPLEREQES